MTYGNTPKDNANTPLGSVYVPNTSGSDLTALEGTGINTDGNGQKSSAARLSLLDGDDATQGFKADAAWSLSGSATQIAILKKLALLLNATLTVGGTITEANSAAILAALDMGQENMANSLSVVMASDQTAFPVTVSNATTLGQSTMANSSPIAIASDQSSVKIKSDGVETAGAAAGSVTGTSTDLFPSADMSAYSMGVLQLTGTWTMTLQAQWSNDNVTFTPGEINSLSGIGGFTTAITANGMYIIPKLGRYLRIRPSAWTSNASCVGTLDMFTQTPPQLTALVGAAQSGTWTVSTQSADITVLASAAQTTTQTQADQTNAAARGVRVVLDMTTVGTGSVTLEIDAKDVASGKYVAMLTGVAVTTNSTNTYVVYPGLTPAANAIVSDILPRTWRVKVVANNANSATYSVGASYLV